MHRGHPDLAADGSRYSSAEARPTGAFSLTFGYKQELLMPDSQAPYPYDTHLNVLYPQLDVVDVPALVAACTHPWYNQTLCKVNDSVVRVGIVQGEYHWHKHDTEDEFFYVVDGRFLIDLEGRTVELTKGQGFVVPKGVLHRPRAPERTVILMVEGAGIVPTGDS
jgi:mannose-6-phosphate isomerase-like protein (cupin superfamily)